MKNKIQEILNTKPKHYTKIISRDAALDSWIKTNANTSSTHYPTLIYCAMNNCSSLCKYNNERTVSRYSEGLANCGPANKCQCTKEDIAKNVSSTKLNYSTERKEEIQSKRDSTMIAKFGVAYNGQRPEVKANLSKPKIPEDAVNKLTSFDWLNEEYNNKGRTASDIANELKIYYSTVIEYCKKFNFKIRQVTNYSKEETEIVQYITSLGFEVQTNVWDIINGKELDIYIPSCKIAIELNGTYWHSYHPSQIKVENPNRHLEKTIACESQGIQLLHITDIEWNSKKDIMMSVIKSKLGLNNRLYARKCKVKMLSNAEVKQFLLSTHIQGYIPAKFNLALLNDEDKLLMLMTIGPSRFNKEYNYEILRISSAPGITVVGGISKLLKHVRTTLQIKDPIISYCDRSKSAGNGYISSGFKLLYTTSPGYYWTDTKNVISRFSARKQSMHKLVDNYNDKLTIDQNMYNNKYRKYWDCGNYVFAITT